MKFGAERGEKAHAGRRKRATILTQNNKSPGGECIGNAYAELAGKMIVTGPGKAHRIVARRTRLIARRRFQRGNRLDAFQHARDQRRGNAIVTISPLLRDRQ